MGGSLLYPSSAKQSTPLCFLWFCTQGSTKADIGGVVPLCEKTGCKVLGFRRQWTRVKGLGGVTCLNHCLLSAQLYSLQGNG